MLCTENEYLLNQLQLKKKKVLLKKIQNQSFIITKKKISQDQNFYYPQS